MGVRYGQHGAVVADEPAVRGRHRGPHILFSSLLFSVADRFVVVEWRGRLVIPGSWRAGSHWPPRQKPSENGTATAAPFGFSHVIADLVSFPQGAMGVWCGRPFGLCLAEKLLTYPQQISFGSPIHVLMLYHELICGSLFLFLSFIYLIIPFFFL